MFTIANINKNLLFFVHNFAERNNSSKIKNLHPSTSFLNATKTSGLLKKTKNQ
jgi:hypothetical protein